MNNLGILSLLLLFPSLWLLLKRSAPRDSPAQILAYAVRSLGQRPVRVYFLSLLSVLAVDVALTALDAHFTAIVGHDYAAEILRLEGRTVAFVQAWSSPPAVRLFFVWVYVVVYPLLFLQLILVLHRQGETTALLRFARAFVLNYVLALPFYLFFPVTEVGHIEGSGATPILDAWFPEFMKAGRNFSGIDNCFPSLHTSLSVTAAVVALASSNRALRWTTGIFAGLIALSTMVLGIHWVADVAAGVPFGALCAWLGTKVGRNVQGLDHVRRVGDALPRDVEGRPVDHRDA